MDFRLSTTDFSEHLNSLQGAGVPPAHHRWQHGQLGNISFGAQAMPGVQAIQLNWQLPDNRIVLSDENGGNGAINISFQLSGNMFTRFAGIPHPLDMRAGSHNLVYLSEQGDTHAMEANQQVAVLQLTVDKQYYLQCLEGGNGWSDGIINKAEKKRPFAAAKESLAITPRMQHLIQSLQSDTKPGPMTKLLLQSRLLELLALQADQYSDHQSRHSGPCADDRQKLYGLKMYLDKNFLDDLSLAQLSRISCLNEFKLKKGFKSCFGETVFGYVRKLRMNHAGTLLRHTTDTVDEIAVALGYEHAHHFSKAFKDYTGHLPGAYRRRK